MRLQRGFLDPLFPPFGCQINFIVNVLPDTNSRFPWNNSGVWFMHFFCVCLCLYACKTHSPEIHTTAKIVVEVKQEKRILGYGNILKLPLFKIFQTVFKRETKLLFALWNFSRQPGLFLVNITRYYFSFQRVDAIK